MYQKRENACLYGTKSSSQTRFWGPFSLIRTTEPGSPITKFLNNTVRKKEGLRKKRKRHWCSLKKDGTNTFQVYIYIYLCGFHTSCLYWVSRQAKSKEQVLTLPPMNLMTSQSLPPSSASSVIIMSHSIDLAGLAHRKYSLTLHCFLTWNSNQSDRLSPPYPSGFHTKQVSHPPTDRSGPGLSADT